MANPDRRKGRSAWAAFGGLALAACGGSGDLGSDVGAQVEARAWAPAPPREGNLRIGTFNIRNFPTAADEAEAADPAAPPSPAPEPPRTFLVESDAEAVLSTLEILAFDVLAVQEIRDVATFERLVDDLARRTGRAYVAHLSQNAGGNSQRVGFVVDTARVTVAWTREHEEVNPTGTLRPGLAARFVATRAGGADFTAMVLHLASGESKKRAELRASQAKIAATIASSQMAEAEDGDYLVLGDLNTARGDKEFPGLDEAFRAPAGLERARPDAACTAYYVKNSSSTTVQPSWLDQVYRTGFEEIDAEVPLAVGAHCHEHACAPFASTSPQTGTTFFSVSDHCPVYFEVQNDDRD